jgi:hypothetical protein
MENYLEKAKRLTDGRVVGQGRYLLITPMTCFLYGTRAEAEAQILDHKHCKVVDLGYTTPIIDTCRETSERR